MPSPEAALLVANGFCTVRLAQGFQLIVPECSKDSLPATLPNFPRPSIKGETHEIICTALSKQAPLPTAQKLAPDEKRVCRRLGKESSIKMHSTELEF